MPFNYDRIKNWVFPELEHSFSETDCILYALGVGYGYDPLDQGQLQFTYERDLKVAPTMAVVLGFPGFWMKDPATGIDWVKVVHAEQRLQICGSLPTSGTVIGRSRVKSVVDKGVGKGAFVTVERSVLDKTSGKLLAVIDHVSFCRGDGGCGGTEEASLPPPPTPDTAADVVSRLPTLPQAALIYRLAGDKNPLHVDLEVATSAGFPRPILHGLATFGVAGHALMREMCNYRPERLTALSARFSSPVFPGETIQTEIWRREDHALFRCRAVERDVVVLGNGVARYGSR